MSKTNNNKNHVDNYVSSRFWEKVGIKDKDSCCVGVIELW